MPDIAWYVPEGTIGYYSRTKKVGGMYKVPEGWLIEGLSAKHNNYYNKTHTIRDFFLLLKKHNIRVANGERTDVTFDKPLFYFGRGGMYFSHDCRIFKEFMIAYYYTFIARTVGGEAFQKELSDFVHSSDTFTKRVYDENYW